MSHPLEENAPAPETAALPDRGNAGLFAGLSFAAGVLGFGALPVLGTIGAIYFGRKARALNSAPNDSANVTFFAGAGVIMGILQIAFAVMLLLLYLGLLLIFGMAGASP